MPGASAIVSLHFVNAFVRSKEPVSDHHTYATIEKTVETDVSQKLPFYFARGGICNYRITLPKELSEERKAGGWLMPRLVEN